MKLVCVCVSGRPSLYRWDDYDYGIGKRISWWSASWLVVVVVRWQLCRHQHSWAQYWVVGLHTWPWPGCTASEWGAAPTCSVWSSGWSVCSTTVQDGPWPVVWLVTIFSPCVSQLIDSDSLSLHTQCGHPALVSSVLVSNTPSTSTTFVTLVIANHANLVSIVTF